LNADAFSRLSIIIVNYNTREDLRLCLAALHECRPLPEIIVVDNASTDGSVEMIRESFPAIRLLAPGRNTWFTGGNNLGLKAATREFVLLLNPDTIAPPEALAALVEFADAHPEYAGVTAQLRYPDGVVQHTCSRLPTYAYLLLNHTPLGWLLPGQRAKLNARHWYAGWQRDTGLEVEVVPGSCILGRRGDWLLNEDLLLYFPEDDLGRRVQPRKFYFLPSARIIHRENSATGNWNAKRIYFRDLIVYTRQHHGVIRAGLLWLLSRPMLWGMWLKRRLS